MKFIKNFAGNWNVRGVYEYSVKKQAFVLFTLIAVVSPIAFALMQWADDRLTDELINYIMVYYGVLAPIYGALYLKGKDTDSKTDGDSA